MTNKQRCNTKIILTFRAIQFVNCLRRRVLGFAIDDSLLDSSSRLGLGRRSLRSLQHGLGRLCYRTKRKPQLSNRVRKHRRRQRHPLSNRPWDAYQVRQAFRPLDSDGPINNAGRQLHTVCSDNELFLRAGQLKFDGSSLNQTVYSLLLVQVAINTLRAARTQLEDSFIIAQGIEIGLTIDEVFLANYEHMLLRLQCQLVEELTRKAVEALILNDLNKTQKKLLDWFSEFPGSQRPLSTTWPWSIKPSLAVLWGVCWMYYAGGSPSRQQQESFERIPIPGRLILQNEQVRGWNVPQPNAYRNFGLECLEQVGIRPQVVEQQAAVGNESSCHRDGGGHTHMDGLSDGRGEDGVGLGSGQWTGRGLELPNFVLTGNGIGPPGTSYYGDLPARAEHASLREISNPDNSGIATEPRLFAYTQEQLDNNFLDASWQLAFGQNNPGGLPPSSVRGHLIQQPRITVTAHNNNAPAQPPTNFTNIYQQHQQAQQLHLNTSFPDFGSHQYNYLPPDNSPVQSPGNMNDTSSIHSPNTLRSPNNLGTPVSLGGTRSSPGANDRSRRPSTASSTGRIVPSEDDTSQDGGNGRSPRRQQAHKRLEEPPRDSNGKMTCKHDACKGITFERRCEWSKHMDKHDRPYKCRYKGCEKLQGFTYSGGLSRHEREVHGTQSRAIFCHFQDCKRSTGTGFTRRENLAEHLRRVHRNAGQSTDSQAAGADTQQEPSSQHAAQLSLSKSGDRSPLSPGKRKLEIPEDQIKGDLLVELDRQRRVNAEQASRIQQLEAELAKRPA